MLIKQGLLEKYSTESIQQKIQRMLGSQKYSFESWKIYRATKKEEKDLKGCKGWISFRDGKPVTDSKGRVKIVLTSRITSLEDALITIGHELYHLNEAKCGNGGKSASEYHAEKAGCKFAERCLKHKQNK